MSAMNLLRLFTAHPHRVQESYLGHMKSAALFSVQLLRAGIACSVHAVLPFLFQRTASSVVQELHDQLSRRGSSGERT
jgi:hypothetical protein